MPGMHFSDIFKLHQAEMVKQKNRVPPINIETPGH